MRRGFSAIGAGQALRIVLAAGLVLMLAANLPGHLSFDSVAQLYEGHFHVRDTWGPAIYAWLLGLFDAVIPGTALYVTASGLLFFASLAGLAAAKGRVSWLSVAAAALLVFTPQVLIYQGIVWKDVAFANTAIGAAACLAQALARWEARRARWLFLAGALVLFAMAGLVRQNGVLVPLVGALALGIVASRGNWLRGAAWTGGGLVAVLAVMQVMSIVCVPQYGAREKALNVGVKIVQNYDLVGAVTLDPSYRLTYVEQADPTGAKIIETRGPANWSPDRIDWLNRDKGVDSALGQIPDEARTAQWRDLILRHPGLYLTIRWQDFSWTFLTPVIDRCLPVYTGLDAPADKMQPMGLIHRYSPADQQLVNYDTWFMDTPIQRHWAYAAIALIVAGVLLLRRRPEDYAVAALMLGALGVTASFFIITIACDYRYLYILDLSALVGLFHLSLDPPWPGPRRAGGRP
jgi:hypothetical protein